MKDLLLNPDKELRRAFDDMAYAKRHLSRAQQTYVLCPVASSSSTLRHEMTMCDITKKHASERAGKAMDALGYPLTGKIAALFILTDLGS